MRKISALCVFVLFSAVMFGSGQTLQAQGKANVTKENVAIGGYDVVAYFSQNEAVRGSQKHAATYKGVNYWFSNAENRTTFLKNPDKYLPQYGGWCAFAMAMKNAKVPSNPKTFKLRDGKLYLFFNDYYQGEPFNTIIPWNGDEANMKMKADANWKTMAKMSHK